LEKEEPVSSAPKPGITIEENGTRPSAGAAPGGEEKEKDKEGPCGLPSKCNIL